jgi:hypothetical protein
MRQGALSAGQVLHISLSSCVKQLGMVQTQEHLSPADFNIFLSHGRIRFSILILVLQPPVKALVIRLLK